MHHRSRLIGALEYAAVKAGAELQAERNRYCLGYVWWLLEPVLQVATLYIVFGLFLQHESDGYLPFLCVGIVVWKGFSATVQHASASIMQHSAVLAQTALPEWVFPVSVCLADMVKFVGLFLVLLLALSTMGDGNFTWLFAPMLLLLLCWLTLCVALCISAVVPLLPDLRFVVDSMLQLGFWASGIFYSPAMLPEILRPYFFANPVACIILAFRQLLLEGRFPDSHLLAWPFAAGMLIGLLGLALLYCQRGEYSKR